MSTRSLAPLPRCRFLLRRTRALFSSAIRDVRRGVRDTREHLRELERYRSLPGAETIDLRDLRFRTGDRTARTPFDAHYLYQDVWAFRRILISRVPAHVDVGSRVDFVAFLSAITRVTFIDIRPLEARLENLESRWGDLLDLPYSDGSVPSLSCLHVAEHVGLGRYGDPLDPLGTRKAMAELARVLSRGGNLYFSLPVGGPRVCFNAHRIHAPEQILTRPSGTCHAGSTERRKVRLNVSRKVGIRPGLYRKRCSSMGDPRNASRSGACGSLSPCRTGRRKIGACDRTNERQLTSDGSSPRPAPLLS